MIDFKNKSDITNYALIGAGAYILYKVTKLGGNVADTLSNVFTTSEYTKLTENDKDKLSNQFKGLYNTPTSGNPFNSNFIDSNKKAIYDYCKKNGTINYYVLPDVALANYVEKFHQLNTDFLARYRYSQLNFIEIFQRCKNKVDIAKLVQSYNGKYNTDVYITLTHNLDKTSLAYLMAYINQLPLVTLKLTKYPLYSV